MPSGRAILELGSPVLVELPSWHLVEQRWIGCIKTGPNGRFVNRKSDYCFKLLFCSIEIKSWNTALEDGLAMCFALIIGCGESDVVPVQSLYSYSKGLGNFFLCALPLEPVGGWEACGSVAHWSRQQQLTFGNMRTFYQPPINWPQMHGQANQEPQLLAQSRASWIFLLLEQSFPLSWMGN